MDDICSMREMVLYARAYIIDCVQGSDGNKRERLERCLVRLDSALAELRELEGGWL